MLKEQAIALNERWIVETQKSIKEHAGKIVELQKRVDAFKARIEELNAKEA